LIPGYELRSGSTLDRALLVKFMQRTYQELYVGQPVAHLAHTVEQYFSTDTPLWWVEPVINPIPQSLFQLRQPIACLWLGNAIDQIQGDRHAHIFLVYVDPAHRRCGIGSALMRQAEAWAQARGDRQIGLQVFQANQPALQLYEKLGYQPQSIWMVKGIRP
jgi:ribosomal protein S18 acetylase RimI-like enzyme